jgi:hypothetical protein
VKRCFYVSSELEAPECTSYDAENERDAKGRKVYVNSHYETLEEAWEHLVKDADAQVSLAGRDVDNARQSLNRAYKEAGEACARWRKIRDNMKDHTLALILEAHKEAAEA